MEDVAREQVSREAGAVWPCAEHPGVVAECVVGVAGGEHVDVLRLEVAVCDCNWSDDIVIFLCERNLLQSSDAKKIWSWVPAPYPCCQWPFKNSNSCEMAVY
mmetsp:Transcript_21780/g.18085  ORF Transcript_21780/g.18085 Transcript_21780/m.18085 type:complete len:102 (+) Transcript_21780:3-308(+)